MHFKYWLINLLPALLNRIACVRCIDVFYCYRCSVVCLCVCLLGKHCNLQAAKHVLLSICHLGALVWAQGTMCYEKGHFMEHIRYIWSTCISLTSSVSSQSKMPQQGSFSTWDVVTTSPTRSSAFIGSACRRELYSRWRRWSIVLCMVPHHLTWLVIHMCRRHAAPTQAQVRLHWTAWRSDLSSVNYRRSCLSCCCSKGVE